MVAVVICGVLMTISWMAENRIVDYNQEKAGGSQTVTASLDSDTKDLDAQDQTKPTGELKKVALTFDDGPDPEYTPALLDGLKERGVKATFFVIGKEAENNPELMQRIVQEGHLIGNHTYSHVDLKNLTDAAAIEEVSKANRVIEAYTGEEPCFIRPPFGSWRDSLNNQFEMIPVLWTIDTMDWACKNEGNICTTVYREVKENSIILMHDEYPTSVNAALSVVDCLLEQGYTFVTVDEIVLE